MRVITYFDRSKYHTRACRNAQELVILLAALRASWKAAELIHGRITVLSRRHVMHIQAVYIGQMLEVMTGDNDDVDDVVSR